ncbi:hypothetical protein MOQ_004822 [Trypanosoma cruzi marinkellei]|uniref:Hsp70 protein n=1 Tax=Trypanosoma cruzi marinkellei TaxID=85056 RepID=K2MW39_TRYCR|nr:hypothetical protein MOQ_004822 [Trypanosoma cruzi marinkellei]
MYAVSISLGSSSAVVAVAAATTATAAGAETFAPIKLTANSAGHRSTPVMAAFAGNEEVLFGEDARALYARTPEVVVPYLFAFAAVAERHQKQQRRCNMSGDSEKENSDDAEKVALTLKCEIEEAAGKQFKGSCPLLTGEGDEAQRPGFCLPSWGDELDEKNGFISAEDVLVGFFNHIKRHTVDGACGLTSTAENFSTQEETSQQAKQPEIILAVVVPRYLFHGAVPLDNSPQEEESIGSQDAGRRDAIQWLRNTILKSHLGAVAMHVSVLFSDEAALLAMDAVSCRPHPSHPMADRYFLLPSSASASSTAAIDGAVASSWPYSRVLVVKWGSLGVSLTRLCLEGGCLVDEPRPVFLRASQKVVNSQGAEFGFAATSCGGGDAVNLALRECLAQTFAQKQRRVLGYQSLSDFPARAQRRLLLVTEEKKVALSKAAQVPVEVEALAEGIDMHDTVTFSRVRVDAALRGEWGFIESFEKVLVEYLHLLEQKEDGVIDAVVLCGGMLNMPCIAQSLRNIFTQHANVPREGRRLFARNLVIMEAGKSTTLVVDGSKGSGISSSQSVSNRITFGAEELPCVGGCLHSYHLALGALQEREHGYRDDAKSRKNGKRRVYMGRKKQERVEGSRRVWLALTFGDAGKHNAGNQRCNEVVVLQNSIFLYTDSNPNALRSAVAIQKEKNAPLQLPKAALSVLFAAHTLLPARVIVPVTGEGRDPFVLYLFMGSESNTQQHHQQLLQQKQKREASDEENAFFNVAPLSDAGVTLPAVEEEEEKEQGGNWRNCIVFTLREREKSDTESAGCEAKTVSLQLVLQLARVATHASEPPVLGPDNVQAIVTLDLGEQ